MDIVGIIVSALLLTITFVTGIFAIILKLKNTKFIATIAQLVIDKEVLSDEVARLSFIVNNNPTIENDFIKFLSESRESAYQYIEEVQLAIGDLQLSMNQDDPDQIDNAYKELIKFLPSTNIDKVE